MAFKMKNKAAMKMAKMAGDNRVAMNMKKEPMAMKKEPMTLKKDPMMMKKEPMTLKKDNAMKMKKGAMKMKKGSPMDKPLVGDQDKLPENLKKEILKK
tara:strand:+ start:478 stop:771 length:294 start_codon:yes stop_codon:yes gene_type:complete